MQGKQLPKIGGKPKIKILQKTDAAEFETELNKMILQGWEPSNVNHQMFYDHEKKEIVTGFLCILAFTYNS